MPNKKNIFENYANYLTDCISEIKFLDKDNLRQYLKTHLNLFYSECLDDHLLPDLDKRYNSLIEENQRLMLERVNMEEQILVSKSALKERKYVDTKWLAKLNYAFKIKGIQIQNNQIELKKVWNIKRCINIKKANDKDRAILSCVKAEFKKRYGFELFVDFIKAAEDRLHEEFKSTLSSVG